MNSFYWWSEDHRENIFEKSKDFYAEEIQKSVVVSFHGKICFKELKKLGKHFFLDEMGVALLKNAPYLLNDPFL